MLRKTSLLLLTLLALALPAAALANPVEGDESASGAGATPVVATLVPQKQIVPVLGSDNRRHAMYELLLTNTVDTQARLSSTIDQFGVD